MDSPGPSSAAPSPIDEIPEPEQEEPEPTAEDHFNIDDLNNVNDQLGHMCIVLSPAVRRQLLRGEPLIIGTSTASVESFFQRLISVCQLGAHMPVMFQTLGGAVTVANIKKKTTGIVPKKTNADRYPIPGLGPSPNVNKKRPRNEAVQEEPVPSTSKGTGVEEEKTEKGTKTANGSKKIKYTRDEIPIEAVRQYIESQTYFPGWNNNAKRNLRKRCKDFHLDTNGKLFYIGRQGYVLPVIEDRAERMNIVWEAHITDHKRRDALLNHLRDKFYWKGLFADITKVLDSCRACAAAREAKENEKNAQPIPTATDESVIQENPPGDGYITDDDDASMQTATAETPEISELSLAEPHSQENSES